MKKKELDKNSYREFCIKTQNEEKVAKYYLMDNIHGLNDFDAKMSKKIAWYIDHMSDRYPLPEGEVVEILDPDSKWWLSTDPLSLFGAMIGRKKPMYHLSIPSENPDDSDQIVISRWSEDISNKRHM